MTYTVEQQKANRKKWCEALRSGDYKQGRKVLHNAEDDTYCCLGAAAHFLGVESEVCQIPHYGKCTTFGTAATAERLCGPAENGREYITAPQEVLDMVGLRTIEGHYTVNGDDGCLTGDNDDGKTFEEIANLIESEPEGLFVDA